MRVKVSTNLVEIFQDLSRIAVHLRWRGKVGTRIVDNAHLPENSRAFRETTPQQLLAQARFSHLELHTLVEELFQQDTLGNLRRAQGLVRKAYSVIQTHTREKASPWIASACQHMRRYGRIRVQVFEELIVIEKKKSAVLRENRDITRHPGNPMVRGHGTRNPEGSSTVPPPLHAV